MVRSHPKSPSRSRKKLKRRTTQKLEGCEGLIEVGNDVGAVLETYRQPHDVAASASGRALLRRELRVRRRRGMDDEAARIADISQMREQFNICDKLDARIVAT